MVYAYSTLSPQNKSFFTGRQVQFLKFLSLSAEGGTVPECFIVRACPKFLRVPGTKFAYKCLTASTRFW